MPYLYPGAYAAASPYYYGSSYYAPSYYGSIESTTWAMRRRRDRRPTVRNRATATPPPAAYDGARASQRAAAVGRQGDHPYVQSPQPRRPAPTRQPTASPGSEPDMMYPFYHSPEGSTEGRQRLTMHDYMNVIELHVKAAATDDRVAPPKAAGLAIRRILDMEAEHPYMPDAFRAQTMRLLAKLIRTYFRLPVPPYWGPVAPVYSSTSTTSFAELVNQCSDLHRAAEAQAASGCSVLGSGAPGHTTHAEDSEASGHTAIDSGGCYPGIASPTAQRWDRELSGTPPTQEAQKPTGTQPSLEALGDREPSGTPPQRGDREPSGIPPSEGAKGDRKSTYMHPTDSVTAVYASLLDRITDSLSGFTACERFAHLAADPHYQPPGSRLGYQYYHRRRPPRGDADEVHDFFTYHQYYPRRRPPRAVVDEVHGFYAYHPRRRPPRASHEPAWHTDATKPPRTGVG
eukprot:gene84-3851_t